MFPLSNKFFLIFSIYSFIKAVNMENKPKFRPDPKLKLLDQVRQVMRYQHYAYRTEENYCFWIKRYVFYHGGQTHPRKMHEKHIEKFLSHLANDVKVSASTQRQALNALVFLYREVLDIVLEDKIAPARTKTTRRPPTVLTQPEVASLLAQLTGTHALMAKLMYGGGLRLMECVRLRIQDVDFGQRKLFVRDGKGGKDRTTLLPDGVREDLSRHIERVKALHQQDLAEGYGRVYLPQALAKKYPGAETETGWQYVFPAKKRSLDPRSGVTRRHHVLESGLQKAIKTASQRAGIDKRVSSHTLRHSFATHMLENGVNIRVLQDLLGHADVKTTEIYTHVMQKSRDHLQSPLDGLKRVGAETER